MCYHGQERRIVHSYSDHEACSTTIRCHKLEELLAAKLKALLQRQHSPDLRSPLGLSRP